MPDDQNPTDDGDKGSDKPTYTAPATQEDLDRIIAGRLTREREKFADYGALKAKAAEHDKAVEAARSDAEKAVEAARKEGETSALSRVNVRVVSAEARALAAEARFRNPSFAVRGIDLSDVKVDDNGDPDKAAIKAKLDDLAKAEPYLVADGKKPPPKPDESQGGSGGGKAGLTGMSGGDLYDRLHPKKKTS